MKLDRNLPGNEGRGKYALLKLRKLYAMWDEKTVTAARLRDALSVLQETGVLDWGAVESESEFFVIRLKDKYAARALSAYADASFADDPEYSQEILDMAYRASQNNSYCQKPD